MKYDYMELLETVVCILLPWYKYDPNRMMKISNYYYDNQKCGVVCIHILSCIGYHLWTIYMYLYQTVTHLVIQEYNQLFPLFNIYLPFWIIFMLYFTHYIWMHSVSHMVYHEMFIDMSQYRIYKEFLLNSHI